MLIVIIFMCLKIFFIFAFHRFSLLLCAFLKCHHILNKVKKLKCVFNLKLLDINYLYQEQNEELSDSLVAKMQEVA